MPYFFKVSAAVLKWGIPTEGVVEKGLGGGGVRGYNFDCRLRVVSNFGDGDCGADEIHTRARNFEETRREGSAENYRLQTKPGSLN